MARSLGLRLDGVWGRSFQGLYRGGLAELAARALDLPLRAVPALASDLYLQTIKPLTSNG